MVESLDKSAESVAAIGTNLQTPEDKSFMGKAIAEVQKTVIGGGTTSMRIQTKQLSVKTVAIPAYRRRVLDIVGFHDPRFVIGEDVELNLKIIQQGFKIMICPRAFAYYYRKHDSITRFTRKMFQYGRWRAPVVKKHPNSIKPVIILPSILTVLLRSLPLILIFGKYLVIPYIVFSSLYLAALFVSSFVISNRI